MQVYTAFLTLIGMIASFARVHSAVTSEPPLRTRGLGRSECSYMGEHSPQTGRDTFATYIIAPNRRVLQP